MGMKWTLQPMPLRAQFFQKLRPADDESLQVEPQHKKVPAMPPDADSGG